MKKIFCSSRPDIRALKKLKSPMPSAALRECVPLSDLTELLLCAYDRVACLAYEKFWITVPKLAVSSQLGCRPNRISSSRRKLSIPHHWP
jgi:hypothetical protein